MIWMLSWISLTWQEREEKDLSPINCTQTGTDGPATDQLNGHHSEAWNTCNQMQILYAYDVLWLDLDLASLEIFTELM